MSKPKKNHEKEPAVKAGLDQSNKNSGSQKDVDISKKPVEKILSEVNKDDPIKQFCAQIEESDFEGTIEFTEKDIDALTPTGDGRNIFEFYQFDAPEKFENWYYVMFPIIGNELAEKHNAHVLMVVPYLFTLPLSEILTDPRVSDDTYCIVIGETFLAVTQETSSMYEKALKHIGYDGESMQIDNSENLKSLVEMVKSTLTRENGYYEDLMEYWYAGHIFHEKDVIWVDLEDMAGDDEKADSKAKAEEKAEPEDEDQIVGCRTIGDPPLFVLNFDTLGDIHTPMDVSNVKNVKVENYRRVLSNEEIAEAKYYNRRLEFLETLTPNEEVWYLATKKASEEETAGFAVVCLHGKFYVPVETSVNYYTHEVEEYIELFNVANCYPNHHNCIGLILADVGNMQVYTGVRYLKGRHFDWKKRIEQELKSYQQIEPDYNPFDDPYDAPDSDLFD